MLRDPKAETFATYMSNWDSTYGAKKWLALGKRPQEREWMQSCRENYMCVLLRDSFQDS
jgi:hypothetical protein